MSRLRKEILPFVFRFSITHTLTYLVFGVLFMFLSGYFPFFASDPLLDSVMKPAGALSVQLAPLVQLLRGALLAAAVYPFRFVLFSSKYGWLKLFFLLYILTSLGAVITGPGSIEGFLYTHFSYNPAIGLPEITFQMLCFSWLFCRWQGKTAAASAAVVQ